MHRLDHIADIAAFARIAAPATRLVRRNNRQLSLIAEDCKLLPHVQVLAFGVKAFQHRHVLGDTFDQIRFEHVHRGLIFCGDRTSRPSASQCDWPH